MTNGLLIYGEIFAHFLIYEEALPHIWLCNCSALNFLIYEENVRFFFYQCNIMTCICPFCRWRLTTLPGTGLWRAKYRRWPCWVRPLRPACSPQRPRRSQVARGWRAASQSQPYSPSSYSPLRSYSHSTATKGIQATPKRKESGR